MKRHLSWLFVWGLLALSAVPLWAQNGTVKGTAKDQAGKPIANATVEFQSTDTGKKMTLTTNSKGEFFSVGVPPGKYTVDLIKDGQKIDGFNNVPVQAGSEVNIPFDLAKDLKDTGVTEEQRQKYETQKKEVEKIKNLNAQLQAALALEKDGKYDEAITQFQELAQAAPDKDIIWANLGAAQLKAKKYPDAVTSWEKAVQIKPTLGAYHNGLAEAYYKSGQTDKAIGEYTAAAQAEPANAAMYYFNEGAVLTNAGKTDEAVAAFDKCIQADPAHSECYYQKGVAMLGKAQMKGDKMVAPDGTAEAFNKYLELAPNGPNAESAKSLLASIGASVQTSFGKGKSTKK